MRFDWGYQVWEGRNGNQAIDEMPRCFMCLVNTEENIFITCYFIILWLVRSQDTVWDIAFTEFLTWLKEALVVFLFGVRVCICVWTAGGRVHVVNVFRLGQYL